jgi:hypothetical protein
MAGYVTTASVHDFKLFSYFFALFLLFLDIDACAFKSFGFYVSHFIHAFVYSIRIWAQVFGTGPGLPLLLTTNKTIIRIFYYFEYYIKTTVYSVFYSYQI